MQRDLISSLVRCASQLLEAGGHAASDATLEKVADTLRAAALDDELREQLARGRVVKEQRAGGARPARPRRRSSCAGRRPTRASRPGRGTAGRRGGRSRAAGSAPRTPRSRPILARPRGVRASTRMRVARRRSRSGAGSTGSPRGPTSAPSASTTTGLTSTSSPFCVVAFLCPVTSTATIRTRWSSCGAARPDAVAERLHRVDEVGRDLGDHGVVARPQLPRLLLQRRVRIAKDLADGHRGLERLRLDGAHAQVEPLALRDLAQLRLERGRARRPGQVDLHHHHVDRLPRPPPRRGASRRRSRSRPCRRSRWRPSGRSRGGRRRRR